MCTRAITDTDDDDDEGTVTLGAISDAPSSRPPSSSITSPDRVLQLANEVHRSRESNSEHYFAE